MRIFYTSFSPLDHSVNQVYIRGLRQNNAEVVTFRPQASGSGRYQEVGDVFKKANSAGHFDLVIVGYDSPQLVRYMRRLTGGPIIYNALCSVYERLILSRGLAWPLSPRAFYYWLLDFLAVRAADLVMLETNEQIKYFRKLFGGSAGKYFRAWTGADDDIFHYDPSVTKFDQFTVIFRGRLLPEAGTEYAIEAAKLLESLPVAGSPAGEPAAGRPHQSKPIKFIIAGAGPELAKITELIKKLQPRNLDLITAYLSDSELVQLMQKCHLSLGQLSGHERATRTIPHKCYESLALGLPYLTAANQGVLELLEPDTTCLTCKPANPRDLADQILWASQHRSELDQIAQTGRELYLRELTPNFLAKKLMKNLSF